MPCNLGCRQVIWCETKLNMIRFSAPLLLLCLFCFSNHEVKSQAWEPFLPQETHTFRHPANPYLNVQVDDTYIGAVLTSFSLNPNKLDALCRPGDSCTQTVGSGAYFQSYAGRLGNRVNHWLYGPIEFIFEPSDTFYLDFAAPIGQARNFHTGLGLTYTLLGTQSAQVLGQADSIARFSLSNGDSILLSKAHGLVHIPDLQAMLYPSCQNQGTLDLVALQLANLGPHMPTFEEVYDFAIGDYFEMRTDVGPFFVSTALEWRKVLGPKQTSVNGDTISYLMERKTLNYSAYPTVTLSISPMDTLVLSYIKGVDYDPGVMDMESEYIIPNAFQDAHFREMTDSVFHLYNGSAVAAVAPKYLGSYVRTECGDLYTEVVDGTNGFTVSQGMGVVESFTYSVLNSQSYLTCYGKNGQQFGTCMDWNSFVGVDPGAGSGWMLAYPNPAQDIVRLATKGQSPRAEMEWELYSMAGQKVKQGQWKAGAPWVEIQLADLPSGMYVFSVEGQKLLLAHD